MAVGIAMLCGAFEGEDAPPRFVGLIFIIFPSLLIAASWILAGFMVAAGMKLKRRVSRMFCLVVAAIECIIMPFGTVLGIFTIILLMKDSVKELFTANEVVQRV